MWLAHLKLWTCQSVWAPIYTHSLSHITNREGKTVEKRERERERRGGEEREGGREKKGGISHCCQAINCSLPGSFRSFNVFQALKLVLGETTMIKPSKLTCTSLPCPFPPLFPSLRAAGEQIAESTPQRICRADPWLISPPHTALPPADIYKKSSSRQKHSVTQQQKKSKFSNLAQKSHYFRFWRFITIMHVTILLFVVVLVLQPTMSLSTSPALSALFPISHPLL